MSIKTDGNQRIGHFLFAGAIAAATGTYLWNTMSRSMQVENLIFVLPLSMVVLLLCLVVIVQEFLSARRRASVSRAASPQPVDETEREPLGNFLRPLAGLILLGVYIFGIEQVGIDIATILFVFLFLLLQDPKRIINAAIYALLFGVGITILFKLMLPYPLPTLIL